MFIQLMGICGVVLILILVGIIINTPAAKKRPKVKKKAVMETPQAVPREFEEKIGRMEHQIQQLKMTIAEHEKNAQAQQKALMVEQLKYKKIQEKWAQEREWQQREQTEINKKESEFKQLRETIQKTQESFSREHMENIHLDHQVKELKQENASLNSQRQEADLQIARHKAQIEMDRKMIMQLKKQVAELLEKKEDTQWIAKSEYERVTQLLREKEKVLERINREQQK